MRDMGVGLARPLPRAGTHDQGPRLARPWPRSPKIYAERPWGPKLPCFGGRQHAIQFGKASRIFSGSHHAGTSSGQGRLVGETPPGEPIHVDYNDTAELTNPEPAKEGRGMPEKGARPVHRLVCGAGRAAAAQSMSRGGRVQTRGARRSKARNFVPFPFRLFHTFGRVWRPPGPVGCPRPWGPVRCARIPPRAKCWRVPGGSWGHEERERLQIVC